ncbi:PEX28-32 family peroxisomal membrane protein [Cyberlindnera jadinii NRRL Y-1542]|uniref:Integral peroxisomal membrane peroxin n=1 Tax=Cyberlindnera jadinii (strain ATCC 18201 / CBS 1600 / BCRC 20928 / JCM 3617 / NBRC 0987 / NRRL Y-1542) TaxID=983966 RepID=A0A1E4S1L6_CYBJN|nr:integral peroxisomal membrane peroxin [Cyberlindnera jadinii NRRL Y-1542]ODV73362.1 integral peroxisomal membrane peroxin [Cyberlindnera jadinii NRRL Y-1542]
MSYITAQFPTTTRTHPRLAHTSPLVTSILQRSFALIVIGNAMMDLLTWTGSDPEMNAVYWITVYLSVYYFPCCAYWLLLFPLLVLGYCSVNYYVNSVYLDINSQEKPTLEEILNGLDNLVTKCELVASPLVAMALPWPRLLSYIAIVTPLNVVMLKWVISLRTYVLLTVIFVSTYHSVWFQASLRILWRSQLVRNVCYFVVGSHVSTTSNNYRIINGNKNGKIIQFQILEHQRRWFGIGWSDKLLPYERSNFTNEAFQSTSSPKEFHFPFNSKHWRWLQEAWHVDLEYCKNKNSEGWVYYDNYWQAPQFNDSLTSFTRSRRWTRKAVLVTERSSNV